ncbi:Mre11 DNA-binding presumed domain-domain-containing protein, partial [Phakopsora pachyrhizi]
IRILLATDNHIGYAESDPIRGRDSINTFREILQLSIQHDVDMLLLAGDLFHENRPSRESLYSTMASLREYCFNSRPIRIELIGDDGIGISHGFNFPPVNYEDENLNVGLPVFSIHGNHDDPQGIGPEGALCALDILSASGLINYFGRQDLPGESRTDEEALEQGLHIQPVLLQKGRTRLALYGIGNIRDERFHYEMRSNRIRMSRPAEFRDEWFNLMLVHQNRVAHGLKNSVPENGFNDDLDLLIWGHEHDCLIQPEEVPGKSYFISQPGSSIATSLAKGESLKKHVAILEIQDRDFSMTPIPLKTVRPFVFHEIVLSEEEEEQRTLRNGLKFDQKSGVVKFLKQIVEDLIKRANEEWEEEHGDDCIEKMLPLIRLRVEYSKPNGTGMYEVGNPQRFGQEFLGKVANPKDVVQFYQKRKISTRKDKNEIDLPDEDLIGREGGETSSSQVAKVQVSTLVHQYLEAQSLGVLAENGMQRAVTLFVEKDDRDAIKE